MNFPNNGPSPSQTPPPPSPSILTGASTPPLLHHTLGQLLDHQTASSPFQTAIISPSQTLNSHWTYSDLHTESIHLARGLQSLGIHPGDRVGVLAGNCSEYIALFFAVSYIGAVLVVLNNTYTKEEARGALEHSGCRILFTVERIGRVTLEGLLGELGPRPSEREDGLGELERVIMLRGVRRGFLSYENVKSRGFGLVESVFERRRESVRSWQVVNFQYTSGSTGMPKAAMLTHFNLINNANSIGDRLAFTSSDVLCCPPPLFHCFGLVLGVLTVITHGATIVLPSETFHAPSVLRAISDYKCTALHGVPTMFEEILSLDPPEGWSCENLRTGIIAGAPVPRPLMKRLVSELGMVEFTSSYGLTEASPTCFNAHTWDTIDTRLNTVGQLLPHLKAKIIDRYGNIVPQGQRGELCIAGYSLQVGYWKNEEKTNEVMIRDEEGTRWLHTGDEASFTEDGYCRITGRFKDIIIRGGENIYPVEIEERLCAHPSISRAAVVGIRNQRYGEVVGAFLQQTSGEEKLGDEQIRDWVRAVMGRHKAPAHVFWLGEEGVSREVPQTGSGKVKKHVLRQWGAKVVRDRTDRENGVERARM